MSGLPLVTALVVLLLTFYLLRAMRKTTSPIIVHNTLSSIRQLLDPPNTRRTELLTARAAANERFVRVFSLTNTFVSPDPRVHDIFVAHASFILRAAKQRGWLHFQRVAIQAVEASLHDAANLDFDALVRDITLRVALVGLLEVDTSVTGSDINTVTTLITFLWSLSKKPEPIPNDHLEMLNSHLRRLIPDVRTFPNPLDYVIPIWETFWRVVATTIAYTHKDVTFCTAFANFHCHPTPDQFRSFQGLYPSVGSLVMESMRLQPPSRHLTRLTASPTLGSSLPAFKFMWNFLSRLRGPYVERADIGALLRSNIWDPEPDMFVPLRHHPSHLTIEQEESRSFVFGYGRHSCIAISWAPIAAGIISAAILDRISDNAEYSLIAGPQIGHRDGWNGWQVVKK